MFADLNMIYRTTSQNSESWRTVYGFCGWLIQWTLSRTKSELRAGQVHEVMDKRLLTATPKERKRLIFADNSYNVYVDRVGVGVSSHGNWRVRFRYLICCWFESFALQNLQAFSKYKVTNVMYTLSWSLFLLWESVYTSVIYKRIRSCIVFQIFP